MKNYFSTDQVQAQNPELMADTVSRLSEEEQKLESELNDSANKRWADVPITPKEIGNNKELLRLAKEAAAPAVKFMKESNSKTDSVEFSTGALRLKKKSSPKKGKKR